MDYQKQPRVRMGFEHLSAQQQSRLGECLWDAHAAGAKILELTAGGTYQQFAEHQALQEFVATMIGLVADALTELRRDYPTESQALGGTAPTLLLAESRSAGDCAATWRLVEETLPALVEQLAERLEQWHSA